MLFSILVFNLTRFLNQKWFFDKLYNLFFIHQLKKFFFSFYLWLDKGILEFFGSTGCYKILNKFSLNLLRFQSGHIGDYLFYIFFSLISICLIFIYYC